MPTYYWNKANFEGLKQLAEALERDSKLSKLAEYCRQRERGLRHRAVKALDTFLSSTRTWETTVARTSCQRVLEFHARTPGTHQFLTHPLLEHFVFPVLDTWLADDPTDWVAVRWLGLLRSDSELLKRALELCPGDDPVRRRLAHWHLSDVDHATHHLRESRLLGDLQATKKALADARAVAEAAPNPKALADSLAEIDEYAALLKDWESYSASPEGTFPEWCKGRGREFRLPTSVYYRH